MGEVNNDLRASAVRVTLTKEEVDRALKAYEALADHLSPCGFIHTLATAAAKWLNREMQESRTWPK